MIACRPFHVHWVLFTLLDNIMIYFNILYNYIHNVYVPGFGPPSCNHCKKLLPTKDSMKARSAQPCSMHPAPQARCDSAQTASGLPTEKTHGHAAWLTVQLVPV